MCFFVLVCLPSLTHMLIHTRTRTHLPTPLSHTATRGTQTKDIPEIAKKLAALPKKNTKRPRLVVITQGADPTIVVSSSGEGVVAATDVHQYPVIPIKSEQIVDTNGAGDAFVGGFLSQLVQGKSTEVCVKGGNYLANLVIQRSGASYPEGKSTFSE